MARRNLYTGKAGERAVVAQFLIREWKVAVPEVDVGDDLFVARSPAAFVPVQVKTCRATQLKTSYFGQFRIPIEQMTTPRIPELVYVFAVYHDANWSDFVLVPRPDLHTEHVVHGTGSVSGQHITLRISFDATRVRCSGRDWSTYRANWSAIPDL